MNNFSISNMFVSVLLLCTLVLAIGYSQMMMGPQYPATCPDGGEIIYRGVGLEDRRIIVDMHNKFRMMVMMGQVPKQPAGIHLMRITWDDQLAMGAELASNSCELKGIAAPDPRFPQVGQNGRKVTSAFRKHIDWVETMVHWFEQYNTYIYNAMSNDGSLNYQQIVWANTSLVGCDYIEFMNRVDPTKPITRMYTCNYGPGGNIIGMVPYFVRPPSHEPMIPQNFLEGTNMNPQQFIQQQFPMPVFGP